MEKTVILLAVASLVNGIQYDGLRVKFGWSNALADVEYFFKIPRTISEAEGEGWKRTERPPGAMKELRMYCPPGRGVCPLFDTAGFVAGLQLAVPVDEYEVGIGKPERIFVKWQAQASLGEPAREYWTAVQYFVSEESLKAGAGPQVENGATLQDGGVWVQGLDGRLLRIPSTEAELNTTDYKKQNCIPNMGTHYYYNMTPELSCDQMLPWAALVTQGDLVGTAFQTFGKLTTTQAQHWFENAPVPEQGVNITIPFAPRCLREWPSLFGLLSVHIYYVNEPWNIACRSGDSIKPGPALDRLILNGYRYASQVTDEIKWLFSG